MPATNENCLPKFIQMSAGKNSDKHFLEGLVKGCMPFYRLSNTFAVALFLCSVLIYSPPVRASKDQPIGPGMTKEFSASPSDVLQALTEVLEDQTIHGTLIYDKQPTLTGAEQVESTPLFPPWTGPGKVFYKIRKDAIAPRNFVDSRDQGTIAVRYVLIPVSADRTRLHIDAIYVENTRRTLHLSEGMVETSEVKAVQDHLEAIQMAEQDAEDARRRRESADLVRETRVRQHEDESTRLASAQSSVAELRQKIAALRHEVERRVKPPGADIKAAPFHAAATVQSLAAYTEVVIVIVTPHWLGVETSEGQRGWLHEDQLELLP
jgi:uncharacterized small protein (DUF1192 family)